MFSVALLVSAVQLTVYVIWWATLAAVVLVAVPVMLRLLRRSLGAVRRIERASADILTAANGITSSTAALAALGETSAITARLVTSTQQLEQHASALYETLQSRVADGSEGEPSGG